MAGAGVVPAVRAFQRNPVQALIDLDVPVWLQLLQEGGERDAHDAAADQDDVDRLVVAGSRDRALMQRPVQEQCRCQQQHHEQAEDDLR
ncbi:hypothetical protein D3C71_1712600 [compost metagenome]